MAYHESTAWQRYLRLMKERPQAFTHSDILEIVTDEETVDRFAEETGRPLGVVYESPYHLMVVDLVRSGGAKREEGWNAGLHTYDRLLPAVALGAVVSVPVYDGKFVLLKQFRHSLRRDIIAFPRGFGEPGISPEENLRKELREEIGVKTVTDVRHLGAVAADTGAIGGQADVYSCQVGTPELKKGYEEIKELILLDDREMNEWILTGRMEDGFTLAALALYRSSRRDSEKQ